MYRDINHPTNDANEHPWVVVRLSDSVVLVCDISRHTDTVLLRDMCSLYQKKDEYWVDEDETTAYPFLDISLLGPMTTQYHKHEHFTEQRLVKHTELYPFDTVHYTKGQIRIGGHPFTRMPNPLSDWCELSWPFEGDNIKPIRFHAGMIFKHSHEQRPIWLTILGFFSHNNSIHVIYAANTKRNGRVTINDLIRQNVKDFADNVATTVNNILAGQNPEEALTMLDEEGASLSVAEVVKTCHLVKHYSSDGKWFKHVFLLPSLVTWSKKTANPSDENDDESGSVGAEKVAEREDSEKVAERLEAERLEAERLKEAARVEAARVEAARVEAARVEAERLEAERVEAERVEAERLEAERVEAERLEAERVEAERVEAERLEAERVEAERLEAERLEAERVEAERLEAKRVEAERLEAERVEAERVEAERLEAERLKAEKLKEAERLEAERLKAEKLKEAERLEAERLKEAERLEAERLKEAERLNEAKKLKEAERLETERVEAERLEAERLEAERVEAERVEAERVEAERVEAERVEAERLEAERSKRLEGFSSEPASVSAPPPEQAEPLSKQLFIQAAKNPDDLASGIKLHSANYDDTLRERSKIVGTACYRSHFKVLREHQVDHNLC